ncbi:MAG: hypothetical protein OQJ77_00980, partial [Thiovulaceae bacterium]|nr:hypothetical protein [Sulfurimonadaceae bacterium]
MRIFILSILALSFFGCSTKVPCNCKCPKCPKDESKVFIYNEPEIIAYKDKEPKKYKEPKQATQAQIYYKKQVDYVQTKATPYWGKKAQVASKFNYVKYAKDF